ncbi:hypothetical protein [uncultured Treponema sp.]|jgi:hypothetical protein|uniref:hypothetical protein n=1 Tax=uncultured Treponema sp. TaxID=162155 RepID=UPI0027D9C87C|nr:hypothetical protein [uncultured Treponema sp.]
MKYDKKGEKGMTELFRRIMQKKIESRLEWNEIASNGGIKISSWMTGIPTSNPTDDDIRKIAPVLGTTFEWLKYGK